MKGILCLLALAVASFADVNVTGDWKGTFSPIDEQGNAHEQAALLQLKQTGTEISGTVGPDGGERYQIQKGKIEGNKVTLEIAGDEHTMVFNLVLSEDTLKGEATASHDGQQMKAKLDLKRAK
jgi:hypothetical protein